MKDKFMSNLLFNLFVGFAGGFISALFVVKIYTAYVLQSQLPKFYSFDLTGVLLQEEKRILKNPKIDVKKEIADYMNGINDYVNSYSADGIVFVSGAVVGNNPYVKDITNGFWKKWQQERR